MTLKDREARLGLNATYAHRYVHQTSDHKRLQWGSAKVSMITENNNSKWKKVICKSSLIHHIQYLTLHSYQFLYPNVHEDIFSNSTQVLKVQHTVL